MLLILVCVILLLVALVVVILLANHNMLGKKVDAAFQQGEANLKAMNSLFVALGFHPPGTQAPTPVAPKPTIDVKA